MKCKRLTVTVHWAHLWTPRIDYAYSHTMRKKWPFLKVCFSFISVWQCMMLFPVEWLNSKILSYVSNSWQSFTLKTLYSWRQQLAMPQPFLPQLSSRFWLQIFTDILGHPRWSFRTALLIVWPDRKIHCTDQHQAGTPECTPHRYFNHNEVLTFICIFSGTTKPA